MLRRAGVLWISAAAFALAVSGCNCGSKISGLDGGSDSGAPDSGPVADAGGGDAGNQDAGLGDAGLSDAGQDAGPTCTDQCTTPGQPACDPDGGNTLGMCIAGDAGCNIVTAQAPCPSALQTCTPGDTACACPIDACNPGDDAGTPADTTCSGNTLQTCSLDVTGGCGIFDGGVACGTHQTCTVTTFTTADCECNATDCTVDAGTECSGPSSVLTCATDTDGCIYDVSDAGCPTAQVCAGTPPAAVCTCPPTGTAVGESCAAGSPAQCDATGSSIVSCTPSGVCNIWTTTTDCTTTGHVCGTTGGAAACQCPPNPGTTFYADSIAGSDAGSPPYPTGVQTPADCRFGTLTEALAAANAATPPASAIATGGPETFSRETFPLSVNPQVTLTTTDSPFNPANYTIAFNAAALPDGGANGPAIWLHENANLSGFTVQQVSGSANTLGVLIFGADGGSTVDTVTINAAANTGALGVAVGVIGSSDATLSSVQANGAGAAGVIVASNQSAATTTLNACTLSGNNVGLVAVEGTLDLNNTNVLRSTNQGIAIIPDGGDVIATITGGEVADSGADGIVVVNGGVGFTSASTLVVTGTTIDNNGAVNPGGAASGGINVQARGATLSNVNVTGNAGYGLVVAGDAGVVATGTSHFDSTSAQPPNGAGAICAGASFSATGATFSNNTGAGIHTGGGCDTTLTNVTVDSNGTTATGPAGLLVEGGTCTVTGSSVFVGNKADNIREAAGTLTVTGTASTEIDVADGGASGISIGSAAFTGSHIRSHNNAVHGAIVNNAAQVQIAFSSCDFTDNTQAGVRVDQSVPIGINQTNSVTVSGCTFGSDAGTIQNHGVHLAAGGNLGGATIAANVTNNTILGHTGTGIVVNSNGTSKFNIQGNLIEDNGGTDGGTGRLVGGVLFTGAVPTGLTFAGNTAACNQGDQVMVFATGAGVWNLSATSCGAGLTNTVTGYLGTTSVGVEGLGFGGSSVTANNFSWQESPGVGADYSGTVTPPTSACSPTPSCP